MKLDKEKILAMSPNASAISNAKKICSNGSFVKLAHSSDDTFYMGECKGSGKSNYIVSADFIDEENPVIRCSCPSRQFPCKHGLALLFEIADEKTFEECEIPEDILAKREKKEKAKAKKEKESAEGTEKVKKAPSKTSKAARTKKINKQIEGLDLIKKITSQLLKVGLSTMGAVSLKEYKDIVKQLGDYYLPGPQILFQRLMLEVQEYKEDQDTKHYQQALECLKKLRAIEKKGREYLKEELEKENLEIGDNTLYEDLGGVWKLEQLNDLGLKKENARLIQLAFEVTYDEASKIFTDYGYWIDLDSGEISYTANYRPLSALKYIKQEDSNFSLLTVPTLTYYPGGVNKRIRWNNANFNDREDRSFKKIKTYAKNIDDAVKIAKNELKNILTDNAVALLIEFEKIMFIEEEGSKKYILVDKNQKMIELKNNGARELAKVFYELLPNECLENQVMFVKLFQEDRTIYAEAHSIITDDKIVRLGF
ncbi:SWIM zinc finger domain-containing protein [Fusobacterium simiae]|uniref:SWIM zinc finger domain-containing protein n=1 Tax=Fusobacterium simiae TaxID=855 RepID=A0ABT4DHD5_FUSSI|nr:SWIM zinc finger family protein [Fusobacterium simiae]MCY7008017.1 SWIM zinc finger domain-containing protein [Fusobacterium simiae]